ncbi:Glycerol kinase [Camellia lanceoleosa]|uniref:Glycerol kinase n=1 Tax=Camellia lanceoleosa TaxID=1840588 RepID=A0ACC0FB61_9ERIC|nr:Glycerol kinase [Camellia lanceoleosa]
MCLLGQSIKKPPAPDSFSKTKMPTQLDLTRWVEHDPMEILESMRICMSKTIDKATVDGYNVDGGLKAIGLTNQRETTVVWSKSTGLHLYNAIVWMDVRTNSICRSISLFIH